MTSGQYPTEPGITSALAFVNALPDTVLVQLSKELLASSLIPDGQDPQSVKTSLRIDDCARLVQQVLDNRRSALHREFRQTMSEKFPGQPFDSTI
jgi:hypothetical protein